MKAAPPIKDLSEMGTSSVIKKQRSSTKKLGTFRNQPKILLSKDHANIIIDKDDLNGSIYSESAPRITDNFDQKSQKSAITQKELSSGKEL
jgi:hypothetical protein